jgi:cation:H+ antiporter
VTTLNEDLNDVRPGRARVYLFSAVALTLPAIFLRITQPSISHAVAALVFGLAIVGAAFMLSWAAEVAQLDISAGLAIAILALIAVLPEYAVDFVFAAKGGESFRLTGPACLPIHGGEESPCSLALANMTGANRLLIGVGWSLVVFITFYRLRKRGTLARGARWEGVKLDREHAIEISFLAVATLYSLTLPLKHSITLWDATILVAIFIAYTIRVSRAPAETPHLVGPARYLGTFSDTWRRVTIVGIGVFAAGVILLVADRFAEALVRTGADLGISEFLLVQWLAPLASEAPELLVAGLFAWRLNSNAGLGTLVSSKVNQWTLLVGTLPIVFALTSHSLHGLPLDPVQREELFLTAAQSFFAVAVITSLSLSLREAGLLFVLFFSQFLLGAFVPESLHARERVGVGVVYIVLGLWTFSRERGQIRPLLRDGFRAPYVDLMERED